MCNAASARTLDLNCDDIYAVVFAMANGGRVMPQKAQGNLMYLWNINLLSQVRELILKVFVTENRHEL